MDNIVKEYIKGMLSSNYNKSNNYFYNSDYPPGYWGLHNALKYGSIGKIKKYKEIVNDIEEVIEKINNFLGRVKYTNYEIIGNEINIYEFIWETKTIQNNIPIKYRKQIKNTFYIFYIRW